MTDLEKCARCGRSKSAISKSDRLELCRGTATPSCLWSELYAGPAPAHPVIVDKPVEPKPSPSPELEPIRAESAQLRQELEAITAELASKLREVEQHRSVAEKAEQARDSAHGRIADLEAKLARRPEILAPLDQVVPPKLTQRAVDTKGWIGRQLGALPANRVFFAGIGTVLGLSLGANNLINWRGNNAERTPQQVTMKAVELEKLLQKALSPELLDLPFDFDPKLKQLSFKNPMTAKDHDLTEKLINALFSDVDLKPPLLTFKTDIPTLNATNPEPIARPSVRELQSSIDEALRQRGFKDLRAHVEERAGASSAGIFKINIESVRAVPASVPDSGAKPGPAPSGASQPVSQISNVTPAPDPTPSNSSQLTFPDNNDKSADIETLEVACRNEQSPAHRWWRMGQNWCLKEKCCTPKSNQILGCVQFKSKINLDCGKPDPEQTHQ